MNLIGLPGAITGLPAGLLRVCCGPFMAAGARRAALPLLPNGSIGASLMGNLGSTRVSFAALAYSHT